MDALINCHSNISFLHVFTNLVEIESPQDIISQKKAEPR